MPKNSETVKLLRKVAVKLEESANHLKESCYLEDKDWWDSHGAKYEYEELKALVTETQLKINQLELEDAVEKNITDKINEIYMTTEGG